MSVHQVNRLLDRVETIEARLKNRESPTATQVYEIADILRETLTIVRSLELGREAGQDREGT